MLGSEDSNDSEDCIRPVLLLHDGPSNDRAPGPQPTYSFRFVTSLDDALCQPMHNAGRRSERNMIDFEREDSGEFSDLYVRLLRAALDETHWSLSPRMRECARTPPRRTCHA